MTKKQTKQANEVVDQIQDQEQSISFDELLNKQGGFVDTTPVKKVVKWNQGKDKNFNFDVYVRKQSFKVFSKFLDRNAVENDMLLGAQMISSCLSKDPEGKEDLMSYEKACKLHPQLAILLIQAIDEVNSKKN